MESHKIVSVLAAVLAMHAAPGPAHAQECCTDHLRCQDGRWCTGIEYCNCWGVCVSGTRPNCNDGDACTTDNCVDEIVDPPGVGYGTGYCQHTNICGGCTDDTDCNDADVCTMDRCIGGTCVNSEIVGCCEDVTDCDDSEVCTTDACTDSLCSNTPVTNCCHTDTDCDDSEPCTNDTCSIANLCEHSMRIGCCHSDPECNDSDRCTAELCDLPTNTCVTTWTGTPGVNCCNMSSDCSNGLDCDGWETCDVVTVPQGMCVSAPPADCSDLYDCTLDSCNESITWCATPPDFCVCQHAPSAMYDTCSSAGAMTITGTGHSREWSAIGDTHCSNDDYAPTCAASGIDSVHTLAIPGDGATNHQLYAYHAMASSAPLDPTLQLYPVNTCGGSTGWACNATAVGSCWTGGHAPVDSNDACFDMYSWSSTKTVLPEGNYSLLVDSANALGGNYTVYVSREIVTNDSCAEAVEVQMGGKWYGNTTGHANYGCAFCTASPTDPDPGTAGACSSYTCRPNYQQAEFELDHRVAPWNRAMGYVIQGTGVSGFNPALSFMKHTCFSNLSTSLANVYGIVCSDDMDATLAPRIVTGVIPSGYVGEVRLHGYSEFSSGQYEFLVQYDADGDGLVDASDSWPSSKWGSGPTPVGNMEYGPIVVGTRPYSDSRTSWGYPNDYRNASYWWGTPGLGAEEVYYKLNVGGTVTVTVSPMARGDSWGGSGIPAGWDVLLWYSNDCSSWSRQDDEGVNGPEERTGVSGYGCVAVDGYGASDGGYYMLEVE